MGGMLNANPYGWKHFFIALPLTRWTVPQGVAGAGRLIYLVQQLHILERGFPRAFYALTCAAASQNNALSTFERAELCWSGQSR